ncbi:MAG TPA: ABC transporter ATP-binding protein [Deltaproteobacteria bacterium]|nr:ABC transporter ATP-binding protein [Deltaproteobacteria bacterium]
MNNSVILKTEHLSKSFFKYQVLTDVNYELKKGEIAAIIGPNGAGKTTFFNLITGYHTVSGGHVFFRGQEITNWQRHKIARIGITRAFQISNIYPKLTTYENVRQSILAQQKRTLNLLTPAEKMAKQETLELLEVTGLANLKDTEAGILSQGDKKKLELALALACKPALLLLDEPTAGMSSEETHETMELVKRLNKEVGLTILFTEHDISVIFGYAEKLSVLHQGILVAEGTPEEVRQNKEAQACYLGEEI